MIKLSGLEEISIGGDAAIYLSKTHFWDQLTNSQIVMFALFVEEMVLPVGVLTNALDDVFKRPISLRDFVYNIEALRRGFPAYIDSPASDATWMVHVVVRAMRYYE